MALAYVNTGTGSSDPAAGTVATAATSLTAGNLIAVCAAWTDAAVTISSIADTALNTYVQCSGAFQRDASNDCTDVWYAKNVSGNASNVVTITFSNTTAQFLRIITDQYSGADTTAPFDVAANGVTAAGTSCTTGNLVTTVADEVIVAICSQSNGGVYTAGTSFTLRGSIVGSDTQSEDRIVSSTGTFTASITSTATGRMFMSAATFKAAAAVAASGPKRMPLGV